MNNNLDNDSISEALKKAKAKIGNPIDNSLNLVSKHRARIESAPVEMLELLNKMQDDMRKSEEHTRKFEKWSIVGIIASVIAAIFTVINFFI